jgi:hypothetical protein
MPSSVVTTCRDARSVGDGERTRRGPLEPPNAASGTLTLSIGRASDGRRSRTIEAGPKTCVANPQVAAEEHIVDVPFGDALRLGRRVRKRHPERLCASRLRDQRVHVL